MIYFSNQTSIWTFVHTILMISRIFSSISIRFKSYFPEWEIVQRTLRFSQPIYQFLHYMNRYLSIRNKIISSFPHSTPMTRGEMVPSSSAISLASSSWKKKFALFWFSQMRCFIVIANVIRLYGNECHVYPHLHY